MKHQLTVSKSARRSMGCKWSQNYCKIPFNPCRKIASLMEDDPSRKLFELRDRKCPVIWIIGAPCTGKSMLCKRLARHYHFCHIDVFAMLHSEISRDTDRGKLLRRHVLDDGGLAPREIILNLIMKTMVRHLDESKGFLIEGFPRTIDQAEWFEELVCTPSIVLYIECPDSIIIQRQHKILPHAQGLVDFDEDTNRIRLTFFHEFASKILAHYSHQAMVVNGDQSFDMIYCEIVRVIDRYLSILHYKKPEGIFMKEADEDNPEPQELHHHHHHHHHHNKHGQHPHHHQSK